MARDQVRDNLRLRDKVVIVTGAGSGIGKAVAELSVTHGAKVVCAGRGTSVDPVAEALGENAIAVRCDVALEGDVRRLVETALQHFGQVDVLVNNAGFGGDKGPLHEQTVDNWDRVHDANLRGVFLGMKYAIPAMLAGGGGAVVNVSSVSGLVGWKGNATYGAAKAGVHQLSMAAALDYGRDNIRVNCVAPGTIWTGLVPTAKDNPEPPADYGRMPGIAMDRWGLANEVAAAVLFLASDEASYITGAVLPVDGGFSIGFSALGAEIRGKPPRSSQ